MSKFTAIYVDSWQSGSHRHSLTQFRRIEKGDQESIEGMLAREDIAEDTVFLFHGWPLLQGESDFSDADVIDP